MLAHVANFATLFTISVYMLGGGGLDEWLNADTDVGTGANVTTVTGRWCPDTNTTTATAMALIIVILVIATTTCRCKV
jgi:ABC-type sugar transport system permease subunit